MYGSYKVEGNILAVAIASGLNGNIPDFSKPAVTLLMEKARSNGPLKTFAKSCLAATKLDFAKAKACTDLLK